MVSPLVVILNAPPSSGKTVAQNHLFNEEGFTCFSFKSKLIDLVISVYNIDPEVWWDWYTTEGKEIPRKELNGKSCRQALIHMSEEVIKPAFGKDYFGKISGVKILQHIDRTFGEVLQYASDDGGFDEEVEALGEVIGFENIYIIQIYRDGYNYSNDSRKYIDTEKIPDQNYISIYNNGTEDEFLYEISEIVKYIREKHYN